MREYFLPNSGVKQPMSSESPGSIYQIRHRQMKNALIHRPNIPSYRPSILEFHIPLQLGLSRKKTCFETHLIYPLS